jgi:hypothetical protein
LFSLPVSPAIEARLGKLGFALSIIAAIVANETFLQRPFNLWYFIAAFSVLSAALLPFLSTAFDLELGLSPEMVGILAHYCFLLLEVVLGILIGGGLSLILRRVRPPG